MRKILWNVNGSKQGLLEKADYVRAQAVCIRTTNSWLKDSIKEIKKAGFDVYGWRWPAIKKVDDVPHYFADEEAKFVLSLIKEGLDGYIVDPESDGDRPECDWDQDGLDELARRFCDTIKIAGRKKNTQFLFGTTSGCDYPTIKPKIPYAVFIAHSDAAYPQIYWAPNYIKAHRTNPDDAWKIGMAAWQKVVPARMKTIPILGDIANNKPEEIARFGEIMIENKLTEEVHIYTYSDDLLDAKWNAHWDALRALGTAQAIA